MSKVLLRLQAESYAALMQDMPALPGVPAVVSLLPGDSEEVLIAQQGSLIVGHRRTKYLVTYRRSLKDQTR